MKEIDCSLHLAHRRARSWSVRSILLSALALLLLSSAALVDAEPAGRDPCDLKTIEKKFYKDGEREAGFKLLSEAIMKRDCPWKAASLDTVLGVIDFYLSDKNDKKTLVDLIDRLLRLDTISTVRDFGWSQYLSSSVEDACKEWSRPADIEIVSKIENIYVGQTVTIHLRATNSTGDIVLDTHQSKNPAGIKPICKTEPPGIVSCNRTTSGAIKIEANTKGQVDVTISALEDAAVYKTLHINVETEAAGTPSETPSEPPVCKVIPKELDFEKVTIGASKILPFTIRNAGGGTLTGSVDESCDDYNIVLGSGAYSLTHGQSHDVSVQFQPSSPGDKTCSIQTGGEGSLVSCTGVGEPAALVSTQQARTTWMDRNGRMVLAGTALASGVLCGFAIYETYHCDDENWGKWRNLAWVTGGVAGGAGAVRLYTWYRDRQEGQDSHGGVGYKQESSVEHASIVIRPDLRGLGLVYRF